MSKKLVLLALVAASTASFVMPSMAAAGEWSLDGAGKIEGVNKTITTLTQEGSATTVECTENAVVGKYTTAKTGEMSIAFGNCKSGLAKCNSAGLPEGVIETFPLTFHNVMLEATGAAGYPNGTPGILITPNSGNGEFATFTCGGFTVVHIKGNGLIGDLTRSCGTVVAAKANITMDFEAAVQGRQKWMTVTTAGTVYDLLVQTTPDTTRTGSLDGEIAVHLENDTTITCP